MRILGRVAWGLSEKLMKATPVRRSARPLVLALSVSLTASGALAQAGLEPPPPMQVSDQFGVDMISGQVSISSPTISVGDLTRGGLSFTAIWDAKVRAWRYSNWGEVKKELAKPDPNCFAFYTVVYMGGSNIFQREQCGSNNFDLIDGQGTLFETGTGYTYAAPDGSVATYTGSTNQSSISQIVRPSGEMISYAGNSVTNNYGYQLFFQYTSGVLTKVTAVNNAVDACGVSATACTFSQTWPSLTFSTAGTERHVTDAMGQTTRIIFDSTDPLTAKVVGVARPTQTAGSSISYTQAFIPCGGMRVTSASNGVGTWYYTYDVNAPAVGNECPPLDFDSHSTTVTDPASGSSVYTYFYNGRSYWTGNLDQPMLLLPTLYSIKDPLNRTTLVSQNGTGLHGAIYPEGNQVVISRNEAGRVTAITNTPKSGSGLSPISVSAVYPSCSISLILCQFPTSTTDARGGVTDYIYDAAGNLLMITGPAPTPGAVRPQTRFVWEQRYAWYKQNGSASITQAATPVWVQVSQSECMTGATC